MLNILLADIRNRIQKRNQNWLAVFTGSTGSGKSYSAMTIAKKLDPTFSIDRVCFTPEEFLSLLNSGTLKRGNVIMFDEAGVGIPSREWYTISNKMVNYVLQTFRRENLGVIFTVPSIDFIDAQSRKLFHNYLETKVIHRKKELVEAKFMEMTYDSRFGKTYFKYPRLTPNSPMGIITSVFIPKPNPELIEAYENKKREFAKSLYRSALRDIKKFRIGRESLDLEPFANQIIKNKERYVKNFRRRTYVDMDLIMLDFGVGTTVARQIKKLAEDKFKKFS